MGPINLSENQSPTNGLHNLNLKALVLNIAFQKQLFNKHYIVLK